MDRPVTKPVDTIKKNYCSCTCRLYNTYPPLAAGTAVSAVARDKQRAQNTKTAIFIIIHVVYHVMTRYV